MSAPRPSRRQLLLTALAGLFGGRRRATAATAAPPPMPAPAARPRRRQLVHRTCYALNAAGECITVADLPPYWEEVPDRDVIVVARGAVTTYTYRGRRTCKC
jgi:hypothetical protein